jgi:hypothetical protein
MQIYQGRLNLAKAVSRVFIVRLSLLLAAVDQRR